MPSERTEPWGRSGPKGTGYDIMILLVGFAAMLKDGRFLYALLMLLRSKGVAASLVRRGVPLVSKEPLGVRELAACGDGIECEVKLKKLALTTYCMVEAS